MGHHATAYCNSLTVGIRLGGEKTVLIGVRLMAMRSSLRRVIGGWRGPSDDRRPNKDEGQRQQRCQTCFHHLR